MRQSIKQIRRLGLPMLSRVCSWSVVEPEHRFYLRGGRDGGLGVYDGCVGSRFQMEWIIEMETPSGFMVES